jgi:hypothetical protein
MAYWGVNHQEIAGACQDHGIHLTRRPVRDFDPHSLRKTLPSAVRALHEAYSSGGRCALWYIALRYIHTFVPVLLSLRLCFCTLIGKKSCQ